MNENLKRRKETPAVRQRAQKEAILAQLRRIPIVQIACEKAGVSRAQFYRLREEPSFRGLAEEAIAEGVAFVTDMSEGQLIQLIKDRNFPAIQLWLRHHHPKYANKVEVAARIEGPKILTPEQEATIERALRLVAKPEVEGDTMNDGDSNGPETP